MQVAAEMDRPLHHHDVLWHLVLGSDGMSYMPAHPTIGLQVRNFQRCQDPVGCLAFETPAFRFY